MLELGVGFAFVGSQYPLEVDGQDYYLDLLFYHLKLRCYVVIDLKMTEFKPEYAGKWITCYATPPTAPPLQEQAQTHRRIRAARPGRDPAQGARGRPTERGAARGRAKQRR